MTSMARSSLPVRFSEDVRGLTELKAKGSEVVDRVVRTRRPTLITRRGQGVAVIVELSEYERLQDEVAFVRGVEAAIRESRDGVLDDHAEALAILDEFGRAGGRRRR
jgi:prevent-host-death family protein